MNHKLHELNDFASAATSPGPYEIFQAAVTPPFNFLWRAFMSAYHARNVPSQTPG